ncbi:hypothetical protein B4Q13_20975, partial [Lacticaseibacillus rhamnosus]
MRQCFFGATDETQDIEKSLFRLRKQVEAEAPRGTYFCSLSSRTVVYKGSGWLDLRAAELTGPVPTVLTVAYKSTVTILVPPGVRVEMTGFGVTQGLAYDHDPGYRLPAGAPAIHVRG